MEEPLWVTVAEAASLSGRSRDTIARLIWLRRLRCRKSGGIWLVYRPALEDYCRYADAVRASGLNPYAAVRAHGGPRGFMGHGRSIPWDRRLSRRDWWEDQELLRELESLERHQQVLEERLCPPGK